ncbi:MAG: PDZ domain-containing protein [Proteobacteria bacterium]|nr:PDZ domain-containing protein [Pseudomonadota bacterium]
MKIKRLFILANLLVITLVVYVAVDTFYMMLSSKWESLPPATSTAATRPLNLEGRMAPYSAYKVVTARDLFKTQAPEPEKPTEVKPEDLKDTLLKISLLGTVTGGDDWRYAFIEDTSTKKQDIYQEGETVAGAKIEEILDGQVVLLVGKDRQRLRMEDRVSAGGEDSDAGEDAGAPDVAEIPREGALEADQDVTVSREDVQQSLRNINQLMTQVRVRPAFDGGKPDGLAVSRIRPDSIFSKMGLQDGDVIQGVNDREIRTVEDVLSLYRSLKNSDEVLLQIKRGGTPSSIRYQFQ